MLVPPCCQHDGRCQNLSAVQVEGRHSRKQHLSCVFLLISVDFTRKKEKKSQIYFLLNTFLPGKGAVMTRRRTVKKKKKRFETYMWPPPPCCSHRGSGLFLCVFNRTGEKPADGGRQILFVLLTRMQRNSNPTFCCTISKNNNM